MRLLILFAVYFCGVDAKPYVPKGCKAICICNDSFKIDCKWVLSCN